MTDRLEKLSVRTTNWIGTPASLVAHTILFVAIFGLQYVGWSFDQILLVLTTAVSLEAIYLAIFIQMTVNRHAEQLAEVGEDVEDIQEEVEDLGEEVVEISEDIEKIQEEQAEDDTEDARTQATLEDIQIALRKIIEDVDALKHNVSRPTEANALAHHAPAYQNSEPINPALPTQSEPISPETIAGGPNYLKRFIDFISLRNRNSTPSAPPPSP